MSSLYAVICEEYIHSPVMWLHHSALIQHFMVVGFTTTYAISANHHWCEFESWSGRGVQHYVIKVCQWLATGQWFSLGPLVSSTNKTDRHDITKILLKVMLNTIKQTNKQTNNILTPSSVLFTKKTWTDFCVQMWNVIAIKRLFFFILQSLHLLYNKLVQICVCFIRLDHMTISWYLNHMEQTVRNNNNIAQTLQWTPLKRPSIY